MFHLILKFVQIKWIHGDTVISTNKNLAIENARADDQGEFVCTATNDYGTNSTKFNLTVLSKHLTIFRWNLMEAYLQTFIVAFLLNSYV